MPNEKKEREPQTPPSLDPEHGVRFLQRFREEGESLLAKRPIVKDDVSAWVAKGRELLVKCFGSDTKNVGDFVSAGFGSWPVDDTPASWDQLRADTLNFQLKLLTGFIELLQIEVETRQPIPRRGIHLR